MRDTPPLLALAIIISLAISFYLYKELKRTSADLMTVKIGLISQPKVHVDDVDVPEERGGEQE